MQFIELFAGCGGMSLGLEAAGNELYFANELSPMASETFAYNIFNEDLKEFVEKQETPSRTLWISSNFPKESLKQRLREPPIKLKNAKFSDLDEKTKLKGKLIVGDINDLIEFIKQHPAVRDEIATQDIDILSGGPPCQSFSMAGKRVKEDSKNKLPLSFAEIAKIIHPKVVLLENVKGITSPFSMANESYYAWLEVAKAFASNGFFPFCMMLNAKYFGVPQNRPRYIMIALRADQFANLGNKLNSSISKTIYENTKSFMKLVQKNIKSLDNITVDDLRLYDMENPNDHKYFNGDILPKFFPNCTIRTSNEALKDIIKTNVNYSLSELNKGFAKELNKVFKKGKRSNRKYLTNHEARNHSPEVKARFSFYQALSTLNGTAQIGYKILNGKELAQENIYLLFESLKNQKLFSKDYNRHITFSQKDFKSFKLYLASLKTKKHSQRAILPDEPSPAQLTIPDDVCHFSPTQLRTLTVREMARLQSFPDWFEFRSKITTGGKLRKYEVPQYTQVGNSVPPLLSYHLGIHITNLISRFH